MILLSTINILIDDINMPTIHSVHINTVIISKYATKIVGTQKRQVACVHGTQDQKQSTLNTLKPAQ